MIRRPTAAALVAVTSLVALIGPVAWAGPASAHTVSGIGATNWKTTLSGLSPRTPGLTAHVVEGGSRIQLTNHGPDVVVVGYQDEPYLRVGPAGVFANLRSPATYLNCSRTGCPVAARADPLAAPEWVQISSGQTALWHDHRAHWMGQQLPPSVARAPNRAHRQGEWHVALRQGGTPIAITGQLDWVPGHNSGPWLLVALALLAVGLVLGLSRRWGLLAAAVGLVIVNDIYHAGAIAWFWSGNSVYRITQLIEGNSFSMAGWAVGLAATWLLVRRRVDGLYAAVFAGASVVLFTGLLDFSVLSRSQAPFAGPLAVDRLTVAVALGLGLGVMLGSVAGIRASRRLPSTDEAVGTGEAPPADVECIQEGSPATLSRSA